MEPLDDAAAPPTRIDPADIESHSSSAITIDIAQLLGKSAETRAKLDLHEFEQSAVVADQPHFEPMLGLISRSVQSAIDVIELPHLRVLVLLSQRDTMSVGEVATLTAARPRAVFSLLDSMEASGWIASYSAKRGMGEKIVLTQQGRDVIDTMTQRRQQEIDEILARMSEEDRLGIARAFNSFAAAAGESPPSKPKRGIAR